MNIDAENRKVRRNLSALVEFSRVINASVDLDFILNNVLLTCLGKFLATKGLIALKVEGRLELKVTKGISAEIAKQFPAFDPGENLLEDKKFKEFMGLAGLCTAEKMSASSECLGVICLGERLNKAPYTTDDIEFLRTILNISATAIQNSLVVSELTRVNRVLDSRVHRLSSLFELGKEFGLISESSKVSQLLIFSVIGQLLVSNYAVVTLEEKELKILQSRYPKDDILHALKKYDIRIIKESIENEEITREYPELNNLGIELAVPMQIQGETKGLILLGRRINLQSYTPSDIEFIYSVGSLAIISLENQRLFKEELEKQKMEEELEIARDIQKNLLPREIPSFSNMQISAANLSSRQVGGDYYDIIPLDEKSFCIAIADVSGKGVPAALLMASLQAFLRVICKHGMDLAEATALINDLITENTMDGKFITFFWGIFDVQAKTLHYINAGHNPPLLSRDGKIIKLTKGGIILGVMKNFIPYESDTVEFRDGDVLVLFTDGVTEAKDKDDNEFGDERLEELVLKTSGESAERISSLIQQQVQNFAYGTVQSDDLTLLVLKTGERR
jgi:phosphoserine phosphatase RsbU/P